uniref:Uncharacterized protein n=1 Tax=Castor canadensis TaxID=51338 RepID=A0A8C0WM97_CASCN
MTLKEGLGTFKETTTNSWRIFQLSSLFSCQHAALCPRPGATHPQGDHPGDGRPDQGSCGLTEGHRPRKSSHAPGQHTTGG